MNLYIKNILPDYKKKFYMYSKEYEDNLKTFDAYCDTMNEKKEKELEMIQNIDYEDESELEQDILFEKYLEGQDSETMNEYICDCNEMF